MNRMFRGHCRHPLRWLMGAPLVILTLMAPPAWAPPVPIDAVAAAGGETTGDQETRAPASTGATIRLLLILAWDGRDQLPHNLAALDEFRRKFSDQSFLHLISPAYFARGGAADAAANIRRLIRPRDGYGMLVGGWKSLAQKAGVIFRKEPTFWGHQLPNRDCQVDCGVDVPLAVYPKADLERILAAGAELMVNQGFPRPRAIAAEGWLASPQFLAAAARSGMVYDLSAVAPELLNRRLRLYPLLPWVKDAWSAITPHSQPFRVETPDGVVTEVPQVTAAIDYLTEVDLNQLFMEYLDQAKREGGPDLAFPLVVYQETARMTLPLLGKSLQTMFAAAKAKGVAIAPMQLPETLLPVSELPVAH